MRRFESTSTGAVFELVPWPGPGAGYGWKDPDGMIWSRVLDVTDLSNGGEIKDGQVVDSEVMRACAKFGGRLPTKEDLERLSTYFEQTQWMGISEQGLEDLHRIFSDQKGKFYWSSSIDPSNDNHAYYFSGIFGHVSSDWRFSKTGSVVCVLRR